MELSLEEIEDRFNRIGKKTEKDKKHEEIFQAFELSTHKAVIPLWHTENKDIDLKKQSNDVPEIFCGVGFTILQNIDIEMLFTKIDVGNSEMFIEKELYNTSLLGEKISEIINHWENNEKLIPPTITINEINSERPLFPTDGKHRINVAHYFGATRIPILVYNQELKKVKEILL
ncbi:hypothetical protein [Flavobacterium hydatis]|uniref:ParB/Sulfiredoxin domain-containing protein n=1 Tax=Flavobacterium hydatis TaxID=991 RepID=A0A086AMQ0_FLAHY|nr:hypothetical protein [Flavobacterium hydatis]KFF17964.1 hypothetical protein IW20_06745 [Flavobacterium hydatis]OXA90870.1 hypothetical protein B0A62_18815 [Flavobacterium hydatis]